MTRRTVNTITEGHAAVRVTFESDLQEYRCRLSVDGEQQLNADYFTDDEDDALNTAVSMARDNAARSFTDILANELGG